MAMWYYHCMRCGHHFKLPKATKFNADKFKNPIYCPKCQSDKTFESTKESYEREQRTGKTNFV